ncbi:MAG: choice-of-anchor Q domain-containing protein [Acidimicrobiales bacterium]
MHIDRHRFGRHDSKTTRTSTWGRSAGILGAVLVLTAAGTGLTACTPTATFTVGSTVDAVDSSPGDGICASAGNGCTLRAAVQEANRSAIPARIVLAPGATYTLALSGAAEDQAATGDLDLTGTATIEGNGATIDGARLDRVLDAVGSAHLTLRRLTITHGAAPRGGGLEVAAGAQATLTEVTVADNEATDAGVCVYAGGSPYCSGADSGGGGIASAGDLSLDRSAVRGNGSGLRADGCHPSGAFEVCTGASGGGILSSGHLGLVNSTISGNQAGTPQGSSNPSGYGGGIALSGTIFSAHAVLLSTIADNIADHGSGILGRVTLTATVIDGGTGRACAWGPEDPANVPGPAVSNGWNVISDSSCGINRTHDLVSVDPQLGALGDHGGPTWTHLPATTSPVVNSIGKGTPGLCDGTFTDQRGAPRPTTVNCDAGSVERQPTDP